MHFRFYVSSSSFFFSQETPLREAPLRLRFVSLKLVVKLFRFCLFAFYGCIFALVASGEIGFVHIFFLSTIKSLSVSQLHETNRSRFLFQPAK